MDEKSALLPKPETKSPLPAWKFCRFTNVCEVHKALLPFRNAYRQRPARSAERARIVDDAMNEVGQHARPPWTPAYMRAWFRAVR
jgi:hypothetical protein